MNWFTEFPLTTKHLLLDELARIQPRDATQFEIPIILERYFFWRETIFHGASNCNQSKLSKILPVFLKKVHSENYELLIWNDLFF